MVQLGRSIKYIPVIASKIGVEFKDKRGAFYKLLDDGKTNIKSILIITSRKGAVRANHWHKKDKHYCYMLSGKMRYSELLKDWMHPFNQPHWEEFILKKGEMVVSNPGRVHKMEFLEDSEMLVLSTRSRHQKDYEKDTVRINEKK